MSRRGVYDARESDPTFAREWDEALNFALDAAEAELYRRAVTGNEEPVFYQGQPTSSVVKYSDFLLVHYLKAHRPEYREKVEVGNLDGKPIRVVWDDREKGDQ